jgi:large subunit ribosomal protein L9
VKVILLENVNKLGKTGELVEVSQGYARNFLFPKGLAEPADEGKIKVLKEKAKAEKKRKAKAEQDAEKTAKQLSNKTVVISVKTGEQGRLYGSITSKDVADAIEKDLGIKIDKKKVELSAPIRALGTYNVSIKLFPGISSDLSIKIVAEE